MPVNGSMTTDMLVGSMVKLKQLCTLTLIKSKPTLSDDPSVSIKYGLFIKVVVESHRLSILVFAAQVRY